MENLVGYVNFEIIFQTMSDELSKTIKLRNGTEMPRIGLGTWKAPAEKTHTAVTTAVRTGYRLIDCANDYDNEHVIGEALEQMFKEGVVKREDMFIQVFSDRV